MMMHSGLDDRTKQRIRQANALSKEARGVGMNLGKKISVPKDVMMEELNLSSNRGSRMFQERQKRAERFTLENSSSGVHHSSNESANIQPTKQLKPGVTTSRRILEGILAHFGFTTHLLIIPKKNDPYKSYLIVKVNWEVVPPPQNIPPVQEGKENRAFRGKHGLVVNLKKTVATKGNPNIIAPGYSKPLKETPHEKFNATVIPKIYRSPWTEALGDFEELQNVLNTQLLPKPMQPANYRCFNRSAAPFGGATFSKRVIPVISFEAVESQKLPSTAQERMWRRPNFNRAPKGWGVDYYPESNEL